MMDDVVVVDVVVVDVVMDDVVMDDVVVVDVVMDDVVVVDVVMDDVVVVDVVMDDVVVVDVVMDDVVVVDVVMDDVVVVAPLTEAFEETFIEGSTLACVVSCGCLWFYVVGYGFMWLVDLLNGDDAAVELSVVEVFDTAACLVSTRHAHVTITLGAWTLGICDHLRSCHLYHVLCIMSHIFIIILS